MEVKESAKSVMLSHQNMLQIHPNLNLDFKINDINLI